MLETFRKHHYILMCFIAVAVIIAFTFIGNPWDNRGGPGGSSQRVGTLYDRDLTLGEVQSVSQLQAVVGQLAGLSQDRMGDDPVTQYAQAMSSIVNTMAPTSRDDMDLDYPINVLVLRTESEKLGIEVEREDLDKFIKEIGAFRTNGAFDRAKLEKFLGEGTHGDRASTETKLFTALRDVMLFQRLAQLVGGTFTPSKAEVDATYATENEQITAATVLIEKKAHENQTITDEDIQKYYDGEKAKKEAPKPADKSPAPAADPLVLSEEKRTLKYVYTEAPKPPVAPTPPARVPPMEDVSKLPEDQKKAKEEEYKKKQEEFTKATEAHTESMAEHATKVKEHDEAKKAWLKTVAQLSDALASDERSGKSFDDIAKELSFELKTATFTKAMPPEEIKKMKVRGPQGQADAAEAIFASEKGEGEHMLEDQATPSYCFFSIEGIEEASLLPLEEVKQKLLDKLKAEKIAGAMRLAANEARAKLLDEVKAGKSFKDAATAAMLTATELPAFSNKKPLPPTTPNAAVIKPAITGGGDMMGPKKSPGLNAGELSEPLEVPEGLLLVYVEKKELPNHPQMEVTKTGLAQKLSFRGASAKMPDFNQGGIEDYMAAHQYFNGNYGGMTNPVLRAWFSARRADAQAVAQ